MASTPRSVILKETSKGLWFLCSRCEAEANAPPKTERSRLFLCRNCYGRGKDKRPRELNDLSGSEWARASKSIETYPDTRSKKQRDHGACFPESLAIEHIKIYTRKGDCVFDPFLGVGTTLDAALGQERSGIGIELNQKYALTAKKELQAQGYREGKDFKIHVADARQLRKIVRANSVDFVLTSPPYSALLKNIKGNFAYKWREHSTINPLRNPRPYSDKPQDLGNMSYEEYLQSITEILKQTYEVMKSDTYSVWIVKDFRDIKNNAPYVNLHGDIINSGQKAGFMLWDIRIFDQTKFRPLVCLGFPSRNFYLNIGHSYILIFRKRGERN